MKNHARNHKKPFLICITGIDGCGKTTHAAELGAWLEGKGLTTSLVSVWGVSRDPEFAGHPFISQRHEIHQYLGRLHGPARALFILHALFESWNRALEQNKAILIADGYWYKYVFTEVLHGGSMAWLKNIAARLPAPRYSIFLEVPPDDAWGRKPGVTPYECGFDKPVRQSFITFQTRLRELFLQKATEEHWQIVQGNRPFEEVREDIRNVIDKEVLSTWTSSTSI